MVEIVVETQLLQEQVMQIQSLYQTVMEKVSNPGQELQMILQVVHLIVQTAGLQINIVMP
jgi:hypothetical protein